MNSVIGDLLPVALGVAISPMPIIAVILMLLSPRAGAASLTLLAGWIVGITVVVTVVVLVANPADDSQAGNPSTLASVVKLLLGVAVVLIGVREWRHRPKEGETPSVPKWMGAIDQVTPLKAFGLGALLSGVNPKNLALGLAGGVIIASGGLSSGQTVVAIAVFVLIGSSTMAIPVVGYLVARERMQAPLGRLRDWLIEHNAAVMSVLLLVIGVVIFGKGLAGL
jgi:Sap, sulfolipid-1-addressing protein